MKSCVHDWPSIRRQKERCSQLRLPARRQWTRAPASFTSTRSVSSAGYTLGPRALELRPADLDQP
jgi:hypothetical protein